MKRSELTLTGETYRLTPDKWGSEYYIMVDEDQVAESIKEAFSLEETPDPDDDENDKPETVEMATDKTGKYYAILPQYFSLGGGRRKWVEDKYRQCQNPADATEGGAELYGSWKSFDDEDDDDNE